MGDRGAQRGDDRVALAGVQIGREGAPVDINKFAHVAGTRWNGLRFFGLREQAK